MDNSILKTLKRKISKSASSYTLTAENSETEIQTTSILTKSLAGSPCISYTTAKELARNRKTKKETITTETGEVKLVPPYGDYCAYEGGGGSGGCVITGPYESIVYITEMSDGDSFESTDQTDDPNKNDENQGKKGENYQHDQLVWVKRPCLPWIPAILIDLELINDKKTKDIIKFFGAAPPSKKEISAKSIAIECSLNPGEKIHFMLVISKKKDWVWLPESKLRLFCDENDDLFLYKLEHVKNKILSEVFKGYKKAREYIVKKA